MSLDDVAGRAGIHLSPDLFTMLDPEDRDVLGVSTDVATVSTTSIVDDAAFVRRVTVLAHSGPLHNLQRREAWQSFRDERFDLLSLALAALDLVTSLQGMDEEAAAADVVALLTELARAAAPDAEPDEHSAVARFVLAELLNDREGGTEFVHHYSDYRTGTHRIPLRFSLLQEAVGRSGTPVLRASVHAINALLGGLDLDVEDAQSAMDTVLRNQINKGQWGRAEETAAKAMLLSIALSDKVTTLLEDTRRDVRSVDWHGEVPALLSAARDHLGERFETEDRTIEWLQERRNDAADPDVAATCVRILELLRRCYRRHTVLHGRIIPALQTFLEAQSEQRFRPVSPLRSVALADGVLAPLLRLDLEDSAGVATVFADAVAGPVVRRLPRLADLYDLLLTPVRTPPAPQVDDEPLELQDDPDLAVEDQDRAAAYEALSQLAVGQARRLSELLDELADAPARVRRFVLLSVMWSYAPEYDDDGNAEPGGSDGDTATTTTAARHGAGALIGLDPALAQLTESPEELADLLLPAGVVVLDDGTPLRHADATGSDLLLVNLGESP